MSPQAKGQAFEKLVRAYEGRVYNLALRLLGDPESALDVTQEAFVKALQGLRGFRRDSSFFTWICRITINLCHSERRRQVRRKRSFGDFDTLSEDSGTGSRATESEPGEASELRERGVAVRDAVNGLEQDLRFVVVLRDMEGMSYEEVAEALKIPIGTVRSRLHRARDVLRRELRHWLHDEA